MIVISSNGGSVMGYYGICHYANAGKLVFEMRVADTNGNYVDLSTFNLSAALSLPEFRAYN